MFPTNPAQPFSGGFRLFTVAGISVYLHWSWFLVAIYEVQARGNAYTLQVWNAAEYLAVFGIVLMHEFGHVLACRQVGGQANRIVLWPLGGVAMVNPPPRPGAMLWSIAAGPLVNLILTPTLIGAVVVSMRLGLKHINPDADRFLFSLAVINVFLLIFNLLPIYPLDGGQILRALLWFVLGRSRSLMVASVIGLIAGIGVLVLGLTFQDAWIVFVAAWGAFQSWAGFSQARRLAQIERIPRHQDFDCPYCDAHPFAGAFWRCTHCRESFDPFDFQAVCPKCGFEHPETLCPDCRKASPIWDWMPAAPPADDGMNQGPT